MCLAIKAERRAPHTPRLVLQSQMQFSMCRGKAEIGVHAGITFPLAGKAFP